MFSGYKGDYKQEHSNGKMNYLKHFFSDFRAKKQFYFCCFELRILVRLHGSRKLALPVISQYLIAVDIIKSKYHIKKIKPRVCWHWLKMALKWSNHKFWLNTGWVEKLKKSWVENNKWQHQKKNHANKIWMII